MDSELELCTAKMRPFPNETEIECSLPAGHLTTAGYIDVMHTAVLRDYAYPGSTTTIRWADDDRRTFRGEWSSCSSPGCILPADHRGNHAT